MEQADAVIDASGVYGTPDRLGDGGLDALVLPDCPDSPRRPTRGRIVAIEIRAGASVGRNDLRAMNKLRELAGDRFVAGLVLCTARQTVPLGRQLCATPIEALWTGDQRRDQ